MAKTTQSNERITQYAAESSFTSRIDDKRKIEGAVQYARVKVPLTTDNAALDVIELIKLPVGSIVLPSLSKVLVTDDATSGALTVDIGDSVDPDRYADGINCASVGSVDFTSVLSGTVPDGLHNLHEVTSTTCLVTLTLATFTATIEAGELIVVIAFKSL